MAWRIKRRTATRFASISALGAGALAVMPGVAEAGPVLQTSPVSPPITLGWSLGQNSSGKLNLPGGNGGAINFGLQTNSIYAGCSGFSCHAWRLIASITSASFSARLNSSFRNAASKSNFTPFLNKKSSLELPAVFATWKKTKITTTTTKTHSTTTTSSNGVTHKHVHTFTHDHTNLRTLTYKAQANAGTKYLQFKYFPNGLTKSSQFGWVKLDMAFIILDPPLPGPNLSIDEFAYSSAPVSGVPEPATGELAGLSALALGAVGLRRWRAWRKKTA